MEQMNPGAVLFVAHGFGGIIVQNAIAMAYEASDPKPDFVGQIAGIVFLGTPHRGNSYKSRNSIVAETARALRFAEKRDFIFDSREKVSSDDFDTFRFLSAMYRMQIPIVCYFESHVTNMGPVISASNRRLVETPKVIVDEISGSLDGFPRLPMYADHIAIARFSGHRDRNFHSLVNTLEDMINKYKPHTKRLFLSGNTIVSRASTLDAASTRDHFALETLYEYDTVGPLSPIDLMWKHSKHPDPYASDIVDMLLDDEHAYSTWANGKSSSFLHLVGSSATGKTSICRSIIRKAREASLPWAYFCYDKHQTALSSKTAFLRAVIHQLCEHSLPYSKCASDWVQSRKEPLDDFLSSAELLVELYKTILRSQEPSQVWLVVDNIDQSTTDPPETVFTLLRDLLEATESSNSSSKILITSCETMPFIKASQTTNTLVTSFSLDKKGQQRQKLLESRISELKDCRGQSRQFQMLFETVSQKSGFNLLVTNLIAQEVLQGSAKEERSLLGRLSDNPDLSHICMHSLNRILDPVCGDLADTARNLLIRAMLATRPLRIPEVKTILSVDLDVEYIVKLCRPLLSLHDQIVSIAHESVRDYLLEHLVRISGPKSGLVRATHHHQIASNLLAKVVTSIDTETREGTTLTEDDAQYAVIYWPHHARCSGFSNAISLHEQFETFFAPDSKSRQVWLRVYFMLTKSKNGLPAEFTLLHFAAFFGLAASVERILQTELAKQVMERDATGKTPLAYSSQNGYENVSKKLRKKLNEIQELEKSSAGTQESPSFLGKQLEPESMVIAPQEADAGEHSPDSTESSDEFSALLFAIKRVPPQDQEGVHSIMARFTESVTRLGDTSKVLDVVDKDYRTLLFHASCFGHNKIVEQLLRSGVDINRPDIIGDTALHIAACFGHLPTVEILLKHGAGIHIKNNRGQTPLHWAARNGHFSVASFLVRTGADPCAVGDIPCPVNNFGEIALPWVATTEIESALRDAESQLAKDSTHTAILRKNVAQRFYVKYCVSNEIALLDKSINIWADLLTETSFEAELFPVYLHNLSLKRFSRHQRTAELEDLKFAIQAQEQLVINDQLPESLKALSKFTLGRFLFEQFQLSQKPSDLDRAVQIIDQAVTGMPDLMPEKTIATEFLGFAYELCGDRESASSSQVAVYTTSKKHYEAAFADNSRLCGDAHLRTLRAAANLVRILKKLHLEREADSLYEKSGIKEVENIQSAADLDQIWTFDDPSDEEPSQPRDPFVGEDQSARAGIEPGVTKNVAEEAHEIRVVGDFVEDSDADSTLKVKGIKQGGQQLALSNRDSSSGFIAMTMRFAGEGIREGRSLWMLEFLLRVENKSRKQETISLSIELQFTSDPESRKGRLRAPEVVDFSPKRLEGRATSKIVATSSLTSALNVPLQAGDITLSGGFDWSSTSEREILMPTFRMQGYSDGRADGRVTYVLDRGPKSQGQLPAVVRLAVVLDANASSAYVTVSVSQTFETSAFIRRRRVSRASGERVKLKMPSSLPLFGSSQIEQFLNNAHAYADEPTSFRRI